MSDFQHGLPQVATGWLLLSHGVFLSAAIACDAVAVNQINTFSNNANLQSIGFGWCTLSIFFTIFTAIMLYRTWEANRQFQNAVFHQTDFFLFGLLILFTFVLSLWTISVIAMF